MSIDSMMLSSYFIPSANVFSICLQSFPPSVSFPVSRLFVSGGQSIRASALASVFPMFIQGWFLLDMTGLISLLSRVFSSTTVRKHQFFSAQPSLSSNSSHPYKTNEKIIVLTIRTFVGKVMALLFNMLSRFVIAFLARSNGLLISWLQSTSTVILEPKKRKSVTVSTFPLLFAIKWWDQMPWSSFFECWVLKPTFSISSFTLIKRLFSSPLLLPLEWLSSGCLRLFVFLTAILIPAYESSSPAFSMMYSAYKLNKQGDNIQPCPIPFPVLNHQFFHIRF